MSLCLFALALSTASSAEIKLDTLTVGNETYQNVLVTGKNADSIFITHSRGFGNVKIVDLDPEVLTKLGYDAKRVKLDSGKLPALSDLPIDPELAAAAEQWVTRLRAQWEGRVQVLVVAAWCVLLLGYILFCYCSKLICQKAGGQPGIAVWIPILQFIPLLQAAGMSAMWFLVALLPLASPLLVVPVLKTLGPAFLWIVLLPFVLAFLTYLVWSVKICRARGIGEWVALFLILPFTNVIAYLGLAFSPARVKLRTQAAPRVRHVSTAQDTAFFLQS